MSGDYGQVPGATPGGASGRGAPRLTGRLLFGGVLVTLGILWTLENLRLVDADEVLRWWPLLLIVFGFARVTGLDGSRRVTSGVLFMLAGTWMLAHALGYVSVSLFRLWPVFLIAVGVSLVWRSMRGPAGLGETSDRSAYPRPFAFMGGNLRGIDSQDLVGFEATAIMGGVQADLRGARARGPEVVVDVFAWWGGVVLIVPSEWRVICEVVPVMGGVEDATLVTADPPVTTLVVRGLVVMGGLELKNTKDSERIHGMRVGVHTGGEGMRRKEVRVTATGVTVTHEDVPPARD